MILLSIDPSIVHPTAAVFDTGHILPSRPDLRRDPNGYQGIVRGFQGLDVFRTRSDDPDPVRLLQIHEWLLALCIQEEVDEVVLELPAKAGAYGRVRRGQRTKGDPQAKVNAVLNRAIGVLMVAAAAARAEVTLRRANALSKEQRRRVLEPLFRHYGQRLPRSKDASDAIYQGVEYLAKRLRREPSPATLAGVRR